MPEIVTHPSARALALFSNGRLSEAQAVTVAAHLETCADCRQALESLPPDSFTGKVRAARPGSSSVPPAPSPVRPGGNASAVGRPMASVVPPPAVPPELANHSKFRILRELGRGGMGVIYLAQHCVMDKPVALKVISPAVLDNPTAVARFLAEVRAAGKLDHPNIARAYDADQAGDLHFLVMEFIEGVSLAQLLEKRGPLSISSACHCVCQAALGLQHAYEQGMVHRDIKPHNLMLTPKGVVKVLDFGLARMRSERQASGRLTQLDSFMGTPEYVSPEQADDPRKADTRSDIYSLGCTLYALLTGQPPFAEGTATQIVLAHIEKDPAPLHEVRPDVPAELSAVVAKMLAKHPDQRYQTPVEVAQALVPFVKPGRRGGAAGRAPQPSDVASAGKGTLVGSDTGRVEKAGHGASKLSLKESVAKAVSREQKAEQPTPAAWWKRPGMVAVAVGAALALIMLAGIIVAVTTSDGSTLVVEVNEPNAEILVKGEKITVVWKEGGKQAEINRVPDPSEVTVKKDGFEVTGKKVEVKDGKRVLRVRLVPERPLADGAGQGAADADIVAKVKRVSGIELVPIPAGSFSMGSSDDDKDARDDEKPRHKVTISQPFYLGKFKVTLGQFKRFVNATGYKTDAEKAGERWTWLNPGYDKIGFNQTDEHPVVNISWNDAVAYCQWLAKIAGAKVRLPYEAEWEYSCRAGQKTRFYFGDNGAELGDHAWYAENSGLHTHPVGQKKPNGFNLYDMHGLTWEWCGDEKRTYIDHDETDPAGRTIAGASHVDRGGSFRHAPQHCRAAFRDQNPPWIQWDAVGFRVLVEKAPPTRPQAGEPRKADEGVAPAVEGKPDSYVSKTTGVKFVRIPAGKILMGSPEGEKGRRGDEDQHEVAITRPFGLGVHAVTVGEFRKFVKDTGYETEAEKHGDCWGWDAGQNTCTQNAKYTWRNPGYQQDDDHPVVEVSWNDAKAFCTWLSNKDGRTYRLPTEAEWEYACRAGKTTCYFFGDDEEDLATYANVADASLRRATGKGEGIMADDGYAFTAPAGRFKANPWGLCDMHGNVWQWCEDYYGTYQGLKSRDPVRMTQDKDHCRVVRGGGFFETAPSSRAATRHKFTPGQGDWLVGFRLCLHLD